MSQVTGANEEERSVEVPQCQVATETGKRKIPGNEPLYYSKHPSLMSFTLLSFDVPFVQRVLFCRGNNKQLRPLEVLLLDVAERPPRTCSPARPLCRSPAHLLHVEVLPRETRKRIPPSLSRSAAPGKQGERALFSRIVVNVQLILSVPRFNGCALSGGGRRSGFHKFRPFVTVGRDPSS